MFFQRSWTRTTPRRWKSWSRLEAQAEGAAQDPQGGRSNTATCPRGTRPLQLQTENSPGKGQRRPGLCCGSRDQLLVSDTSDLEAFDDFLSSSANDACSSTSSLTSG
ncbi:unnamed protein product [Boreogadus saida]